jgi:Protein of unknown function (DUF551)
MSLHADWRPIETAPTDQNVMVFSRRWGALIAEYSSEFRQWFPRMQCPVSLRGEEHELTHWMPLPIAPEAECGAPLRGLKWSSHVGDGFRVAA